MSQRTTGQHVLPRFLLTGFTAFTKKKQKYTYLFRSGYSQGVPTNVLDAAKRRLFYGEPQATGIETALQEEENRYAPAVYRTRETGTIAERDLETLFDLIANLSIRTHHLRAGLSSAARRAFEAVQEVFTGEQAAQIVYRLLRDDPALLREPIRKAIRGAPYFPREPQLHLMVERAAERFLFDYLDRGELPFAGRIERLLKAVAETFDWEALAKRSHIQALQQGLSPQARVDVCRRFHWTVLRSPERSLILGDYGPLGVASETGELRPLSVLGKKVEGILMPLSHDRILAGYSDEPPSLDCEAFRRRVAALSSEFFVAAQDLEGERKLVPLIGTEGMLLTEAEFKDIRATLTRDTVKPTEPRRDKRLSITVGMDGGPSNAPKAERELSALAGVLQRVFNETGLTIETRVHLLVTDDLRGSVRSVANGYGYTADVQTEGRTVPVLGKSLYATSSPPFEGTVVLDAELWSGDALDLALARYQLAISQVAHALSAGRRQVEGERRTLESGATFQEELDYLAEEMLDAYDAQHMALAFVSEFFSAHDDKGDPASPADGLASAYVVPIRVLLLRLGEIVSDRVQPYRERRAAMEDILPAAGAAVRELALLLGIMLGMSSNRVIKWLPDGLADAPGFAEYLEEDWSDLIHAFRDQEREEAARTLVSIIRNVLARMGLYIDDLEGGARDLLVGTPRFLKGS